MLTSIDLVLLDLGNTLYFDPAPWPGILQQADAALWRSLRASGIEADPAQILGQHASLIDLYNADHRKDLTEPTTRLVLKRRLRQRGYEVEDETLRTALRAMYAVTQANWHLEPQALPLLEGLRSRGFHVGVISNAADEDNTQALIDKGGIRPFLEFILSSAAYGKRKPHPGIFLTALDHFRIAAEQAVMVGDTYEADILGAKSVGMKAIWIRRKPGDTGEVPHPMADAVVTGLGEIPDIIAR